METDKNDSWLPCVGVYCCVSSLYITISLLWKSYHCDLHVKDIDPPQRKSMLYSQILHFSGTDV